MPEEEEPEPAPLPPPIHPSKKGKAPQVPTRRSTRIPQLTAKDRAIQQGEATTGEEYDHPPSASARRL
jgi:hypothetical protein